MLRFLGLGLLLAAPALAAPRIVPASDLLIRQSSPDIEWRWRVAPEAATQPALLAMMRRALAGASATGAAIVKWNVEPWPGPWLSTHIVPPISSANRLLIARPSPVPPRLPEVSASGTSIMSITAPSLRTTTVA